MYRPQLAARRVAAAATLLGLVAGALGVTATVASAVAPSGTINVTTTADEFGTGAGCSLREAVESVNTAANVSGCTGAAGGGPYTIVVPAGTYTLTGAADENANASGDLDVKAGVTIQGAGASATIVDANHIERAFDVIPPSPIDFTMSGLTIQHGDTRSAGRPGGAAMYLDGPVTATITDSVVTANASSLRGAIEARGPITLTRTTVSNNATEAFGLSIGGGLYAGGQLTVNASTFSGNTVAGAGGAIGIAAPAGTNVSVDRSTFTANTATVATGVTDSGSGGAISITGGVSPSITRNSFSGNSGALRGGAIAALGTGILNATFNRIAGNTAGGGSAVAQTAGPTARADARLNWWGCNSGPGNGGCDGTAGSLTTDPRMSLRMEANPSDYLFPGSSRVSLVPQTSTGGTVAVADRAGLFGVPVSFGTSIGTLSNADPAISSTTGVAQVTITDIPEARSARVEATADFQVTAGGVNVYGPSTTTITTVSPVRPTIGQAVTVAFTVTSRVEVPGRGLVTVTDGVTSCTAKVSDGSCQLTFATAGLHQITASLATSSQLSWPAFGSTSAPVDVTVDAPGSTTTITGYTPSTVKLGTPITVSYTVAASTPGGGTPAGNVVVSDGVDSCTATVAAGSCAISLTTTGTRQLTANYQGSVAFGASTSDPVVAIVDGTPPALTLPANITTQASVRSGATVIYSVSATDDLTGATVSCSPVSGTMFSIGTTTVRCTATDGAGNDASGSFTVTVSAPGAKPTVTGLAVPARSNSMPVTVTATANASGDGATVTAAEISIDGNAPSSITATYGTATVGLSFDAGGLGDGTHDVSITATDSYGRTSLPATGNFTVDRTAPELTVPGDVITTATARSGRTVTFAVSASDAIDGAVAPTCTPPSGSLFPIGVTTVACTATDATGNRTSKSFAVTVTVPDGTPTVAGLSVPAVTNAATLPLTATATAPAAGAAIARATAWVDDTTRPASTLTVGPGGSPVTVSGDLDISGLPDGYHTAIVQAVDDYGHPGHLYGISFLVDRTAPTLAPVVTPNPVVKGAVATVTANASDPGSGLATVSCGAVLTATLGDQTVACTATDNAGNTATASASYTVVTAPPTNPADLKVTVASKKKTVSKNGLVTFTVKVRNLGPGPAYSSRPSLTFDSARLTPTALRGGIRTGDAVTWLAGTIPAGATRTFTITFRAVGTGATSVTAHVVAAVADPNLTNNYATRAITVT